MAYHSALSSMRVRGWRQRRACAYASVQAPESSTFWRTAARAVEIQFRLPYRVQFGQSLSIVGSGETLGSWDVATRVPMEWSEGDIWEATVACGSDAESLEYKYIVVEQDGNVSQWKPGSNFEIDVVGLDGKISVQDAWDGSQHEISSVTGGNPGVFEKSGAPESAATPPAAPSKASEATALTNVGQANNDDDYMLRQAIERAFYELEETLGASLELVDKVDPTDPRLLINDQKLAAVHKRATSLSKALDAGAPPPAYILKQIEHDHQKTQPEDGGS